MPLVVLLRGVNVGGHRRLRPSLLARECSDLGLVNIGAAGTFIVRQAVSPARLRAILSPRLPFACDIVICDGREILDLVASNPFAGRRATQGVVRFVSTLARVPSSSPPVPFRIPAQGSWLVQVLGIEGRFVFGLHRRQMRVLACLGTFDRLFGMPVTTRSWSTIRTIAERLAPE